MEQANEIVNMMTWQDSRCVHFSYEDPWNSHGTCNGDPFSSTWTENLEVNVATGNILCSNSIFGDLMSGVGKKYQYKDMLCRLGMCVFFKLWGLLCLIHASWFLKRNRNAWSNICRLILLMLCTKALRVPRATAQNTTVPTTTPTTTPIPTACVAGQYENNINSTCVSCPAGKFHPWNISDCEYCVCVSACVCM